MRYAVVADLHGRRKAWRAVRAAAAAHAVDRVVCLGDYLEAKVSRRRHDPARRWSLDQVVRLDEELWRELAGLELIAGNQEVRIRELLAPADIPPALAPLLAAPRRRVLGAALCLHGDQLGWDWVGERLRPVPAGVPRVPLLFTGHTHQTLLARITWPDGHDGNGAAGDGGAAGGGGADGDGGATGQAAVHMREPEPGRPVAVPAAPGGTQPSAATVLVNVGAAREKPSHWLLYDDDAATVSFQEAPR